jgi:hypothetical protein
MDGLYFGLVNVDKNDVTAPEIHRVVIDLHRRFHRISTEVGEPIYDLIHFRNRQTLRLGIAIYSEDEHAPARMIGEGHDVLGEAFLIGRKINLPVKLIRLAAWRGKAVLQKFQ